MNPKSLFYTLLASIAGLVILTGIGLWRADKWLATQSNEIISAKLDTAKLEEQLKVYQRVREELNKNSTQAQILEKVLPKNKDQASVVAELLTIASENNTRFNSIVFPSSDLGAPVPKPVATPASSPAPEASPTPAPTPKPPTVTQAKPVEGLSVILGIETTISQITNVPDGKSISYAQVLGILKGIERNRRTMQIKSLQIQPVNDAATGKVSGYTMSITLTIFVKP